MRTFLLAIFVFLICDPGVGITHYVLEVDGGDPITVEAPLRHDLSDLSNGPHTINVKAKNAWGLSEASPLSFTKGVPDPPSGIGLSE